VQHFCYVFSGFSVCLSKNFLLLDVKILNWDTDTLPPDTLPHDQYGQRRQDAAHIMRVGYTSLQSHHLWWRQGVAWLSWFSWLSPTVNRHLHDWPEDLDTKYPWQSTGRKASLIVVCLLLVIGWVTLLVDCCSSFLLPP